MSQRVVFYLPKGAIFEATAYYCTLIERAFTELGGFEIIRTEDPNIISENDILVSIRLYDASHAKCRPKKIIHWFQGIAPEERIMESKSFKSIVGWYLCRKWEKIAVNDADICLFVSNHMKNHFSNKYNVNLNSKSVVIPCYNIPYNNDVFAVPARYEKLNFVYAGGLHKWQCIDETLEIFKSIQEREPSAHLTLLTKEIELAKKKIERHNVKNVSVKFVSVDRLQEELTKYKYGFLIRKNHIVNNVATPTKMNSYLSSGLIPIYTPFVKAFEENLVLNDFGIKINNLNSVELAADLIIKNHENKVLVDEIKSEFLNVFNTFYNDRLYIDNLKNVIQNI